MNQRERTLAVILLAIIFIGGGGLVGYLFYFRNLSSANVRLQKLQQDVDANDRKLREVENSLPRLQQMKKLSLPADVNMAQREYAAELSKLLRQAEFTTGSFTVNSKPIEKVQLTKRPPYTRLYFDIVDARGDLMSIVAFLDSFYRVPLLHRIKTISIVRPATPTTPGVSAREQRQNELVLNATVEALVLDGAEKRDKLLPDDVKTPERLAHSKEQYVSIAGRNVFFGPAPARTFEPPEKRSEVDVTEFIVLDEITHDPDRGVQASLYDAFNNYKYLIKRLNDGSFLVSTYFYVKDVKKRLNVGEELEIQGDTGETQISFKIARIDATDVILQDSDTGKFYRLHVGLNVKDAKGLSKDELKALGLDKDEKKDAKKENDKPADKDVKKAPPPKKVDDEGK